MSHKKKRIIAITSVFTIFTGFIVWLLWANTALKLNAYTIANSRLPSKFDGYRIAHISDLHNAEIGPSNRKLLQILEDIQPDIIAITGDLVDSRRTNIDIALRFAREAIKIAPCYYVAGNNESWITEYDKLRTGLKSLGVAVLEDTKVEIRRDDEKIKMLGVVDPSFYGDLSWEKEADIIDSVLYKLNDENETFTLLLIHRPDLMDIYAQNNCDLVLSGHAHGGQVRLPFVGGLVAPDQGFFPYYDSGLYTVKNTDMIVSRGIGNSIIPLRVNNRPEVILVELKKASRVV